MALFLGLVALVLGAATALAQEAACSVQALRCCELPKGAERASVGFGVHVWPSRLVQSPDSVERLLALKPSHLRFSLGPNWRRQPPLRPEMTEAEIDALVAQGFANSSGIGRHVEIMRRMADAGARLHLVVWEPPPTPGEPDFTVAGARRWRVLAGANVQLAARFHVANIRHIASLGLRLHAIELSNEPDGSWNIRIAPADYVALVKAVRAEAARRGVALPRIYGPGASRSVTTRPYLADPKMARELLALVDVFSLHTWDDAVGKDRVGELEAVFADLARLGPVPPIAITEYGLGRIDPTVTDPRMSAKNRVPGNVAETPVYAGASFAAFLRLLRGRVSEVIYWEFEDQSWGGGLYGLLDVKSRPKPIYDVYRELTRSLAELAPDEITVAPDGRVAILHGKRRRAFLVNPGAQPLDVVMPEKLAPAGRESGCRAAPGYAGFRLPPGAAMSVELPSGAAP